MAALRNSDDIHPLSHPSKNGSKWNIYLYKKKKKKKMIASWKAISFQLNLNINSKLQCGPGQSCRPAQVVVQQEFWVFRVGVRHEGVQQLQVSASGLLAAPLVGHRPAKQLLHMTGHIHGVLQVEVPIWIQHVLTTDQRQSPGIRRRKFNGNYYKDKTFSFISSWLWGALSEELLFFLQRCSLQVWASYVA